MRKTVYQSNYDRLINLGIVQEGHLRANGRSRSGGFMDLVFETLPYLDGFNGQALLSARLKDDTAQWLTRILVYHGKR